MICANCGQPIHLHRYFNVWIHDHAWRKCPSGEAEAQPKDLQGP